MVADELKSIIRSGSYNRIIEALYLMLISVALGVSVFSFYLDPFGELFIGLSRYNISSVTLMVSSGFVLLLWFLFNHVDVLPRIICSISLPILGLSFHEAWWHVGWWYTWNWNFNKVLFMILYTVAIFVSTIILHIKYNILKFSIPRLILILLFLLVYRIGWQRLVDTGFFFTLLEYERGLAPSPHGLFVYLNASIGRTVWLLLANRSRKEMNPFKDWEPSKDD